MIGVVIRTLNESQLIERCLETLRAQRGDFDLDILVVDSGSTDSTVELARAHGARIVTMPPGAFDYSKALNVGLEQVSGDLAVILSAHTIPVDDRWLERMTAPFEDERVAGVASRQVPWPDAPWQEVHRLEHQFADSGRSYSKGSEQEIVFSNSASLIRRGVWREHPFTLPVSEDLDWARRVVAEGWIVVYEPAAGVYHSHYDSPREQALRMVDFNRLSDVGPRTRMRTVREAAGMLFRDSRKILGLDEPLRRKLIYLAELVRMVCYYVVDFSRSGTIAERRREHSLRETGDASDVST